MLASSGAGLHAAGSGPPLELEQPTKRSKSNNDKSAVAVLKKGNWQERENPSQMLVTIERGNLGKEVITNWDKIHLNVDFLMHDNCVAYFRT